VQDHIVPIVHEYIIHIRFHRKIKSISVYNDVYGKHDEVDKYEKGDTRQGMEKQKRAKGSEREKDIMQK
jgi:hypothetical protein